MSNPNKVSDYDIVLFSAESFRLERETRVTVNTFFIVKGIWTTYYL